MTGNRHHVHAALLAASMACAAPWLVPMQGQSGQVTIDPDDIGGTVTSANGPEAGVWVVAETTDLPTRFARIVGLWASYSTYATWHIEGGKGEGGPGVLPKAVKFQMRPNPLAK